MNDNLHNPGPAENQENNLGFQGTVQEPQEKDLEAVKSVLEQWVIDGENGQLLDDEVQGILSAVRDSIYGKNSRKYVVAKDVEGHTIGIMGMTDPGQDMLPYTKTDRPVEFINAFVDKDHRGGGIGRALADKLGTIATANGHTEIIVNSGPRYKDSGWDFWTKMYGEPVAVQKDLYGPGLDAPVWRKILE